METGIVEKSIENVSLKEVIERIKEANYQEVFSKETGNKIWQIYTKEEKEIIKVACLSDTRELFTTQIFKKYDDKEEKYNIEFVAETYVRYDLTLKKVKRDYRNLWIWALIGALCLGSLTRRPLSTIMGGIIGAITFYLHKLGKIYDLKKEKSDYERGHSIKFGRSALNEILRPI